MVELVLGVGLLVLGVWFLFGQLGKPAFHDGDEALYAAVSLEMAESGDWLTPNYWGEPFLHKPPLQYWLTAIAFKLVPGSIEFQARFPSALAGLILLGVVYWTARRLAGVAAGAAGVLILLLNHQFLFEHAARSADLDTLLTLLCFVGVAGGAYAHGGRLPRIVSAVSISAVMLVKGPLAVFPLVSVLVYQLVVNRRTALCWLGWLGAAVAVLVLPWHIQQLWTHRWAFWDTFFVYEMFGRAGSTVTMYTSRFVHLDAFWRSFVPWSPLLVAAVVATLVGSTNGSKTAAEKRSVLRLFSGYVVLLFVFLCFTPSKWPWYGLPAYPALAVVGTVWACDLLRTRWRIAVPITISLLAAGRILLVDANPLYAPATRAGYLWPAETTFLWFADAPPSAIEWVAATSAVFIGVAIPLVWRSRRITSAAALVVGGSMFFLSAWTIAAVPREHDGVMRELARELQERKVDTLYLMGFPHQPRYNNRMAPLSSVYFLALRDVDVIDCDSDVGCISPDRKGGRSAMVIRTSAAVTRDALIRLVEEAADRDDRLEIWTIDPAGGGTYRRVK